MKILHIPVIVIILLLAILFGFSAYLLKDVPSIYSQSASLCKGDKITLQGKYLSYEKLSPTFIKTLKAAEPTYKNQLSTFLSGQMPRVTMGVHHTRSALIRLWLEQFKEEDTLAYYSNNVYFGDGCYGADAAAKAFFNKEVSELTPLETAKLIAAMKSSQYSVLAHPEQNTERAKKIMKLLESQPN